MIHERNETEHNTMTKLRTNEFVLNLGIICDALDELAVASLQLQKTDMTVPCAHTLVSRQVRVFRSMVDKPGKYATQRRQQLKLQCFTYQFKTRIKGRRDLYHKTVLC